MLNLGIKIVRLTTSEELLCTVDHYPETQTYTLKNPTVLIPREQNLALVPWMPYVEHEDGISIKEENVLFMVKPLGELEAEYNSIFGNGLIVPDKTIATVPDLKITD